MLTYGHYISLGQLKKGTTRTINMLLQDNSNGQQQGSSFADQIASSKHLPVPYTPFTNGGNQQTPTELQRHMAMLSALSGEGAYDCSSGGGSCYQSNLITAGGLVITNGNYNYTQLANGGDPLMLPDAPATLIGWAENPTANTTNAVTINDTYTSKTQEMFFQAPLNMTFAGKVNLPSASVNCQLVDVQTQGTGVQTLFPGVYALSSGSMTFEFTLPTITSPKFSTLTISTAASLPQVGNTSGQGSVDANHLHPYLYNWQKHTWDAFTFTAFAFSTGMPQPYLGPGGRILLQVSNTDSTQATAIFGRPSLQLLGTSSGTK